MRNFPSTEEYEQRRNERAERRVERAQVRAEKETAKESTPEALRNRLLSTTDSILADLDALLT